MTCSSRASACGRSWPPSAGRWTPTPSRSARSCATSPSSSRAEQRERLGDDLARALLRAPTRPHPDTGHGRLVGGFAFWADGVVDRVRDSLDSRTVPTPRRVVVPRPVTRWGAYALGAPTGDAGTSP